MLFGAVDELRDGLGAIWAYFGKRGPEARVKSYPEGPAISILGHNRMPTRLIQARTLIPT